MEDITSTGQELIEANHYAAGNTSSFQKFPKSDNFKVNNAT
jgi:hypothetical protein